MRYQPFHALEAERATRALQRGELETVCLAADGTRKPVGRFTVADIEFWAGYHEAKAGQEKRIAAFAAASVDALARPGVTTPAQLPTEEREHLARLEARIVRDIEELGEVDGVRIGPTGELEFLVAAGGYRP